MLRAIIFDFDGVIADTERLHLQGFRLALSAHDISITDQDYLERYLGLDDRQGFEAILGDHGVDSPESTVGDLMDRKARIFRDLVGERVEIFPGVRELLADLRDERRADPPIPLAIGSGALGAEVRLILRIAALDAYFAEIVAADDVVRGKPHPETFLEACARLARGHADGLVPEECIVIEDSIGGVNAALQAGMKAIAVTNSHSADAFDDADLVVGSLCELDRPRCSRLFS